MAVGNRRHTFHLALAVGEIQAAAMKRGRALKRWCILLAILASVAGVFLWWRSTPAPPRWTDIRKGDGAVLSLAAGRAPAGNEIIVAAGYCRTDDSGRDLRIVCYDADDGRVRWETREDKALPNMMIHPVLAIDSAGDVLAGWETAAAREGGNKALSKYSGADGRLRWEWVVESATRGAGIVGVPATGGKGILWVSGIRRVSADEYHRFVAALDPETGATLWQEELNPARDADDRIAQVHHLDDGGAVLLVPPLKHERSFPWFVQKRSAGCGLEWQYEILRDNDRNLQPVGWVVDETRSQVILVWNHVAAGRMRFETVALDLRAGGERWSIADQISPEDFAGGVRDVTHGADGSIEYWGIRVDHVARTKWWRWRMDHGIPYPETETYPVERPVRVAVSPVDGSAIDRKPIAKSGERVVCLLANSAQAPVEVVILRTFDHHSPIILNEPQVEPWRAATVGPKSWRQILLREPGGPAAYPDFPEHAALTPSGRLVVAGDPEDRKKRQWQLRVW